MSIDHRFLPKLKILSETELEWINETALKILEDVGVRFHHKEALDCLNGAGARIEGEDLVKIPRNLVEDALNRAPSHFTLYNRDITENLVWGNPYIHFGAGGSAIRFLDSDGKTSRNPTTEDLLKTYQLIDALPEVSWMAPGFIVKDVPVELAGVWRFYLRLKFGSKPSCPDGISIQDLIDNLDLLRIVRGSEETFYEKPFGPVQSCPTPPLTWSEEGAGFLVEGARARLPISFISMPFAGAGAPATVAGSIVQQVAETLSGLVLVQTISSGNACIYAGAPAYMDMRYGTAALSSIEAIMMHIANTQMGKYYDLPTGTGDCTGHSDSKLTDFQAGAESAMSQFLIPLAGNNGPVGLGFLESQATYSLEKLVADHEICRSVKRLIHGIHVSKETLALEVIKDVGAGGNFLEHQHTLHWFRKEYLFPIVFDRQGREGWEAAGWKDTHSRAREHIKEILNATSLNMLDPIVDNALDQKMDSILQRRGLKLSDFKSLLPSK